ncbi:tandem-95 repeat protein [Ochrobactrum daejeonense]|nr:tandem-95 repeat protein [Brucella daejeonensis]
MAVDDTATTAEDTLLSNIDVLGNDSDADGDPLTVTDATSANGGTVTVNPDGTLNYTPPLDFTGDDVVTYTVDDGNGGTTTGTITVTVTPVNDAPVATAATATTDEDTAATLTPAVTDADGDPLTYSNLTSANGGTVTDNGDGRSRTRRRWTSRATTW